MADVVSVILLILGLVLGFLALLNVFAKASRLVGVVGIFLIALGGLGMGGFIDYTGMVEQSQTQGFTGTGFQQQPAQVAPSSCSPNAITSTGKSQADVLARNIENSTGIGYLTGAVSANANGAFIDSVTTNAGGSGTSYASMSNVPNCGKGELVGTVTTGIGFASSRKVFDVEKGTAVAGYDFTDKAVHKYELRTASGDVLNILARSSSYAEASSGIANGSVGDEWGLESAVSGTGTADGTAYYTNTSIGAKGSINFYIDAKVNGSSSVFGAYEEPDSVIVSYDTGTAAKFSSNSLSLISDTAGWSLNKLATCPNDIKDNRNTEACWSAPSMKAGVLYRIRGTIVGDNGDVVASDTKPEIWFDDKVFFRDTDGSIKYQSFSSSGGTNQGVGGTSLEFVMS